MLSITILSLTPEKISKIFASLETLLNEVVESTSKNNNLIAATNQQVASSQHQHHQHQQQQPLLPTNTSSVDNSDSDSTNLKTTTTTNTNTKQIETDLSTFTRRARNLLMTAAGSSSTNTTSAVVIETQENPIVPQSTQSFNRRDMITKQTHPLPNQLSSGKLEISSSINNRKHLKHVEVGEFLKKIGLTRYEVKFISNGYDDIYFLVIYNINFFKF